MNPTTDLTPEVREAATAIERAAQDIHIVTAEDYTQAGEWLKTLKSYRAMIEEKFGAPAKAAHEAWKKMVALRKEADTPADNAENLVKRKMAQWSAEQERIRQEAQRKAEEAARKEAEKQKAKEIKAALKDGADGETIEEMKAAPVIVAPVMVQTSVPKVAGISIRKAWDFKVTDPNAVPRQYLIVDEGKIGKVVRALKGEHGIPGIEAYEVTVTAAARG